jgi:hypothetical protein
MAGLLPLAVAALMAVALSARAIGLLARLPSPARRQLGRVLWGQRLQLARSAGPGRNRGVWNTWERSRWPGTTGRAQPRQLPARRGRAMPIRAQPPVAAAEPRSSAACWRACFSAARAKRASSIPRSRRLGGALPADRLAAAGVGQLAAVMHKEAARAGELVRLPGDHPERELLIG